MSRIVIVLGREPVLDMAPLIKQAWRESAHLVILNLGLPLTPRQQRMSDAALEAAGRGSIGLDELVVFEAHQVAKLIREADQIVLAASRRERKRINTALRQRRLGGSSHPKQRPQPSQPGRASPDS